MTEKKQCSVCNKEFSPCDKCLKHSGNSEIVQWRRVVCCPEHFSFHLPIINYVRKNIDKETAKKELQTAIKYYGEPDFNDNVKYVVDEIMAEPVIETTDKPDVENESEYPCDIVNDDDVGEPVYSETKSEKHKIKK